MRLLPRSTSRTYTYPQRQCTSEGERGASRVSSVKCQMSSVKCHGQLVLQVANDHTCPSSTTSHIVIAATAPRYRVKHRDIGCRYALYCAAYDGTRIRRRPTSKNSTTLKKHHSFAGNLLCMIFLVILRVIVLRLIALLQLVRPECLR